MDGRFFTPGTISVLPVWGEPDTAPPVARDPRRPAHDPPLCPRDEAVFLLTAAAEIEHALMVQYLFAAYSVRVVDGDPDHDSLLALRELLLQVAREEMGHLATVQNLLHLLGGPLNLGRDDSRQAGANHPFRFTLEPLTLGSLAKYVVAESPTEPPDEMSPDDRDRLRRIHRLAIEANGGQRIRHVGPFFDRLAQLLSDPIDGVADAELILAGSARQARFDDWGFAPRSAADGQPLIVASFAGSDGGAARAAAVAAVRSVGAQGEGFDLPSGEPDDPESHFERFFDMYRRVEELQAAGIPVTWPVVTDPNTSPAPPDADRADGRQGDPLAGGRITHPVTRAWAQLFNLRYRLLLGMFSHFLRLDQPLYRDAAGPQLGDHTARGLLLVGTFDEMRRLGKIAGRLVRSPLDLGGGRPHAGPPFELPYALELPDGEPQRWRTHADVLGASRRLVREQLLPPSGTGGDRFLDDLLQRDARTERGMRALADGGEVPSDLLPTGFAKAVHVLEDAVRGFSIGVHGNFWAGRTRGGFLAGTPKPVRRRPDGSFDPVPDNAPLVRMVEGRDGIRMPLFRPPVPAARIGFLRQWIADGCPDDDPPDRIGVVHEPDPDPAAEGDDEGQP